MKGLITLIYINRSNLVVYRRNEYIKEFRNYFMKF